MMEKFVSLENQIGENFADMLPFDVDCFVFVKCDGELYYDLNYIKYTGMRWTTTYGIKKEQKIELKAAVQGLQLKDSPDPPKKVDPNDPFDKGDGKRHKHSF